MAKEITIVQYDVSYQERWDKFVLHESMNGTFLQTRNFLNYHPKERFTDNSLIFLINTTIIAVLPAHEREAGSVLCSHGGSTYGGLVVGKTFCKIAYLDMIFQELDNYLKANGFKSIILKQTGRIYQNSKSELLDYYFFINNYVESKEVGYYIDFSEYNADILSNLSSSKRRDYRYSLKNNLEFREITDVEEISQFYDVLCDNYTKFGKMPVHTLNELIEFKEDRLKDNVRFYGVYEEKEMIAGGMIFIFNKKIFHTQYLAVRQDKKNLFANEFLYVNLIEEAQAKEFEIISFGTSTFEGGKVLNRALAQFKEGFGTCEYINSTYTKRI